MEFIFGFIIFILACYISFYLPGKFILSYIFPKQYQQAISFLSLPSGIAVFIFLSYIGAWSHIYYLPVGIIIGIILFAFFCNKSIFEIKIEKIDIWSLGIILLGSLAFLSLTAMSYIQTSSGLQFIGTTNVVDGLLHIGNTKELLTTFPPDHIGLANIQLRGYHYFYDLLMSRLLLFYHLKPEDLYYRYLPLLISLLYGGGFYLLTSTKNKISQRLVLFFAYFAQSFAFVLSFFIHSIPSTAELGSIYPLELILNPAIILSVGMFLSFVYMLLQTKPKIWQMVLMGFLFGMVVELKVYTGLIGISVFTAIIFLRILKDKHNILKYLSGLFAMGFVVLVTYAPNNLGAGSLWFSPFFAYSVFMQEPPFTAWHWEEKRIIFRDHNNIPHLLFMYIQAIGLFWLLSLGSRVVAVLGFSKLLTVSFWKEEKNLAIFVSIFVPIFLGSFFVQSVSIFDIKQFFWIAGCLVALPAGIALGEFMYRKNHLTQICIIFIILFFSAGGVVGQIDNFVSKIRVYTIPSSDVFFLQRVSKILPEKSWILYLMQTDKTPIAGYPFNLGPTIAALTGHETYVEAENTIAFGKTYDERKKKVDYLKLVLQINCKPSKIKKYIARIGSNYIISPKDKCLEKISKKMDSSDTGLTLYKVKL